MLLARASARRACARPRDGRRGRLPRAAGRRRARGPDPDRRRDGAVRRHAEQRRPRGRVRRAGRRGDFGEVNGADLRGDCVRNRGSGRGCRFTACWRIVSGRPGMRNCCNRRCPTTCAGLGTCRPMRASRCRSGISACTSRTTSTISTRGSIARPTCSRKRRLPNCRRPLRSRNRMQRRRCRVCLPASGSRWRAMRLFVHLSGESRVARHARCTGALLFAARRRTRAGRLRRTVPAGRLS